MSIGSFETVEKATLLVQMFQDEIDFRLRSFNNMRRWILGAPTNLSSPFRFECASFVTLA
jgi:hypothetical protein